MAGRTETVADGAGAIARVGAVGWIAVGGGFVVGTLLILLSYRVAQHSTSGYTYFDIFWTGAFLIFGPVAWLLTRPATGKDRTAALALAGIASYLPHFLRAPTRPYLNDEFGHFLQAQTMFSTGRLFLPNPIVTQAANYPGLEALTVALRHLTGLGTYRTGTIIITCAHLVVVFCIYQFARLVLPESAAAIAALIYAISPQFGFVDSIYAYESLGLPCAVASITAAALASRTADATARRRYLGLCAIFLVTCILTHHLSSFAALFTLATIAIAWLLKADPRVGRRAGAELLVIAVLGSALATGWILFRHANTFSYLTVYLTDGWQTLADRITGRGVAYNGYTPVAAQRTPLSSADKPIYELVATLAAQPILLVLSAIGIWRRRHHTEAIWVACAVLSLMYFASLPLLLSASGQNAAHRSWAFTYIGLAPIVAAGLEGVIVARAKPVLRRGRHRVDPAGVTRLRPSRRAGVIGLVLLLLVGSYGAGLNTLVAFPGPFVFQSDGRNVPGELYTLASWFRANAGAGNVVLSDYRTSVVLAAEGGQRPDVQEAAELILPASSPSRAVISGVRATANYVVIDRRLTSEVSSEGFYFWEYEPAVKQPLAASSVSKLTRYSWLREVHRTDHYVVYQVLR